MNASLHDFDGAVNAWMASLRARGLSARTEAVYRCALLNLARFLGTRRKIQVSRIKPEHLLEWQRHLVANGNSSFTMESFTLAVRRWYAWQVRAGRLFMNPAKGLVVSYLPRPMGRCPSVEDMRSLLNSVTGADFLSIRDRAILEVAYSTGARVEELSRLELASLDLSAGTVRLLGKGDAERMAPLTRSAIRALRRYLQKRSQLGKVVESTALWVGTRGGHRLARAGIFALIRKRGRRVGLCLAPHDIRRAVATHLLSAGASPAIIKELLGHRSYKHLRRYLKIMPVEALQAAKQSPVFR